jgi:uncharacterized protein YndB with AHSA1/START domain
MRFLARIIQVGAAVAITLAVVLWFAARRGDRGIIDEEVTIARPAPVVFRWISSEDLVRRWVSNLVELRRADATPTQLSASGFQMTQVVAGRRVEMALRVAKVVPNQELSLLVSSGNSHSGFSGDANFKLIPEEDYTRLLFTSHTQFVSLSDRILEPALTFATQRKVHDDLAKLKFLMESEPDTPANPRHDGRSIKPVTSAL